MSIFLGKSLHQCNKGGRMKCWHCKTELIWGGDIDCEDDTEYSIETNLSCPECKTFVLVFLPRDKEETSKVDL